MGPTFFLTISMRLHHDFGKFSKGFKAVWDRGYQTNKGRKLNEIL